MNKDVVEIMAEVTSILDHVVTKTTPDEVLDALETYVQNKRLEFVEPQGDCV